MLQYAAQLHIHHKVILCTV